jgi:hypothetical protein
MGTSIDGGEFGVAAVITLFAAAEESGRGERRAGFSPAHRRFRNDKAKEPGNNDKTREPGSDDGRAVRNHRGKGLTGKQLGEIGEAEFLAKASGMGFVVSKPGGTVIGMTLLWTRRVDCVGCR